MGFPQPVACFFLPHLWQTCCLFKSSQVGGQPQEQGEEVTVGEGASLRFRSLPLHCRAPSRRVALLGRRALKVEGPSGVSWGTCPRGGGVCGQGEGWGCPRRES